MDNSQWMLWGGALMAGWRSVMAFAARVRALVVVKLTARARVALALRQYAERHWRRLPVADRFVISAPSWVRPLRRVAEVAWETPAAQPAVFLAGRVPVMLGGCMHPQDINPQSNMVTLSALRGTLDLDAVIVAAVKEFNDRQMGLNCNGRRRHFVRRVVGRHQSRNETLRSPSGGGLALPHSVEEEELQHVARFLGWGEGDVGAEQPEKPMAALALAPVLQEAALEFERWLAGRGWYRARGVPWRRGWLLYGEPGTGKTSFVRALAQQHDLPVYSFDLSTLSNEELIMEWAEMQESAPCIALIEDIDGVFQGRVNVLRESGSTLTFDCLLNCLSGIQTADGVFVVATTNHLEHVDAALGIPDAATGLSSRPGRLDRVIEVPPLGRAEVETIINRIVGEWPEEAAKIRESLPEKATAAQVTERCVTAAQRLYWREAA